MPGIIGLISEKNEELLFSSMIKSIHHFDYDENRYIKQGIHLGSTHHSFSAKQEHIYTSEDSRYTIVFDGELFDFNDESILESVIFSHFFLNKYIEEGISFLTKINGHFQACIYDHADKTLHLISDKFSTRPLYYTVVNQRLLFSPEVKALLKDNIDRSINYEGISDLFHLGHLFGYKTLFSKIHQLPEASSLILKDGEIQIERYWDYPYIEEACIPRKISKTQIESYSEQFAYLLERSIDSHLKGESATTIIPLSGGLDSRWIVARANALEKSPLTSFTMGGPESEDRKYAIQVVKLLDIDHKLFDIKAEPLWEDGKLFSFISDAMSIIYGPIQNLQPYRYYKTHMQTIIAPQMCDAIFGSTLFKKRPQILINKKKWDQQSEDILTGMFNLVDINFLKLVFQPEFFKRIEDLYLNVPRRYIEKDKRQIYCYFKLLMNEHGRRGTLGGNLINNLFFNTRMPSYETKLMEFAFNVPVTLKENQYLYRYTFSRNYPQLARIPRQGTNLPINVSNLRLAFKQIENRIINRAKKTKLNDLILNVNRWNRPTYIQYAEWFRNELMEKSQSLILDKKTLSRGIYIEEGLRRILNAHFSGQNDHFRLIWQIINLEYFYRNFID